MKNKFVLELNNFIDVFIYNIQIFHNEIIYSIENNKRLHDFVNTIIYIDKWDKYNDNDYNSIKYSLIKILNKFIDNNITYGDKMLLDIFALIIPHIPDNLQSDIFNPLIENKWCNEGLIDLISHIADIYNKVIPNVKKKLINNLKNIISQKSYSDEDIKYYNLFLNCYEITKSDDFLNTMKILWNRGDYNNENFLTNFLNFVV